MLVPLLAILSALIVGGVIIALGDLDTLKLWGSDPGEALSTTWQTISDAYVALFEGALGGLGPQALVDDGVEFNRQLFGKA